MRGLLATILRHCAMLVMFATREFATDNGHHYESYFGVALTAVTPVIGTVRLD